MASELTSSVGRYGLMAAGGYALGPIGAAAGALVGSFLFGSSGPKVEGPRLGDLSVSSSTYGGVIPLGFGAPKVAGTMIWATDIVEEKTTRTVGGGLFGGGQDVTEYRYYANFAVAFGEGPAVDVPRLWAGEKLIYDRRNPVEQPDGVTSLGQLAQLIVGSTRYRYRVYLGSENQEPDPLIAAKVLEETGEADAAPAHRGMVYVVFERLPLEEWNNGVPPVTAEIAWSGERPNTVRNATFLLHEGGTSFQRPQLAHDPERSFLYLGTTDGAGGMHRIRTDTMVEDLHVEGANLDPKAVDHRGDIYATTTSTIRKFDGSSYREIASRTGLNNPAVSLMSGYDALGQRYDFVLCMEAFGDRWIFLGNARAADTFSPLGTIWDGGTIGSDRKAAPIGGRRGVGDCEGWFVGGSLANQPAMPITHVRLDIALVANSLLLGLDAPDQGIEASELVVAAADFGTTGLRFDGEVAYDEANDRLLVVAVFDTVPDRLLSIDKDQGVVWSVELATNERLPDDARFTGDKIYTISPATGATVRMRDAGTGALLLTQGPFGTADVGISGRALFDERRAASYLTGTHALHQVVANRTVPGAQPLGEIVQALCARAGLTAADLDVSELTDGVRGYALARQVSVRGALEMLAAAYLFDAVESEHQLNFIKRGREPVRVVPSADLVPVSQDGETFALTRAQEVDLPVRFTVNYQDLERDGDIGSQYAKRVLAPNAAMRSQNQATFDVPLS